MLGIFTLLDAPQLLVVVKINICHSTTHFESSLMSFLHFYSCHQCSSVLSQELRESAFLNGSTVKTINYSSRKNGNIINKRAQEKYLKEILLKNSVFIVLTKHSIGVLLYLRLLLLFLTRIYFCTHLLALPPLIPCFSLCNHGNSLP